MVPFIALLGSAGLIALVYVIFFLLIVINQKLGAMTKMKPYYRWLYVTAYGIVIAFLTRLLRTSVLLAPEKAPSLLNSQVFYVAVYHIPLSVGMTIALMVMIKYWGWLLRPEE